MLDAFVAENRDELVRRCRAKAALRSTHAPAMAECDHGVPRFLDQLVGALRDPRSSNAEIGSSAALHGRDLNLRGFTVSQVVHGYGDVCQSITELALQLEAPISLEDFRALNRCVDEAIASAVTEFGRSHGDRRVAESARENERLGFFAHEIGNLVGAASVAFELLRTGNVGVDGSTESLLQRSLAALRDLTRRSLADVRVRHDRRDRTQFSVGEFIADVGPAAALGVAARGLSLKIEAGESAAWVDADRPILAAVVMNLLQNAFKFTRPGTTVTLRVCETPDRVLIEVEDECGGLPDGTTDDLFRPFVQRSADRTGVGLGLAMCRWGSEANNGQISVRNLPHHGCVFTVSLPRLSASQIRRR